MKGLLLVLALIAILTFAALAFGYAAGPAGAHRHGCHRAHTCPSDHATYRWRGWHCVKPASSKRNATFRKRIRYAGLTYYCKR